MELKNGVIRPPPPPRRGRNIIGLLTQDMTPSDLFNRSQVIIRKLIRRKKKRKNLRGRKIIGLLTQDMTPSDLFNRSQVIIRKLIWREKEEKKLTTR